MAVRHFTHTVNSRTIEHICVLDLVGSMLDAMVTTVQQIDDEERRGLAAATCSHVAMHTSRCRRMADGVNVEDWETKSLRRYTKALDRLKARIVLEWPGSSVNAIEFLSALIGMVAGIEEQLPRTNAYIDHRVEWGRLHTAMYDLYSMFDPDLEESVGIDRGCAIASAMCRDIRHEGVA